MQGREHYTRASTWWWVTETYALHRTAPYQSVLPVSCRALGNLGNALLAQGELKKALLEELRLAVGQPEGVAVAPEARRSLEVAEARLRCVCLCFGWIEAGVGQPEGVAAPEVRSEPHYSSI